MFLFESDGEPSTESINPLPSENPPKKVSSDSSKHNRWIDLWQLALEKYTYSIEWYYYIRFNMRPSVMIVFS